MQTEARTQELPETGVKKPSKDVEKLIRYHVWGAAGVSLVPIPLIDFVALTGIQLNMLRKIANVYNVPFSKDKVKNIISSLVGGALPPTVSGSLSMSLSKLIPVMGQTVSVITMPVVAGATTYAVGKVFTQHFASGGTFLTFDSEKVKAYYTEMLKEGKKLVAGKEQSNGEAETPPADPVKGEKPATDVKKEKESGKPDAEPKKEKEEEKKESGKPDKKGKDDKEGGKPGTNVKKDDKKEKKGRK